MLSFEELEALDNKSLRTKCLEYGLPNVPITDTSRKILIKKLKVAMEIPSSSNIKANKSRRETLHLSQTSTNIEKEELKLSKVSNRRTTIATIRKEKDESKKNISTVEKRRVSRSTPIQETPIPISPPKENPSIIMEEMNFDEEFILIDDEAIQPVVTNIPIIRKSRSPSLSKSAIVTTSYKKDSKKKENIIEEEETEEEGYVEKSKEYNLSKQFVLSKEKDICNTTTIPRYNLSMSTQASSGKAVNTSGYKSLYPSLSINAIDNAVDVNIYESNLEKNKRNYKLSEAKAFPNSEILHSFSNNGYSENSDSNFEDDIVQQAPYLSDFARRLSNLKAEKLDMGIKKKFILHEHSEKYVSPASYINNSRSGVRDSLHQLWVVVNRKYKITKFLLVLTIIFLITFIYYYYPKY